MRSLYTNDGSTEPPKLLVYLNLDNLVDLRDDTIWPGLQGLDRMERLAADGFEGVQITDDRPPVPGASIPHCGLNRINIRYAKPLMGVVVLGVHPAVSQRSDPADFSG